MSLGLRFYRTMRMSPPGRQVHYLFDGLREGPYFLTDALKVMPDAAFYQPWGPDDPVEVYFEDDCVRNGPNVMWLWSSNYRVQFDYFFRAKEPLREWGYVFWDQKRLQKWNLPNEEYSTWIERRRQKLRKSWAGRA